ncbi:MAG: DUF1345 domain-containing protein [Verrucomicrobiota bacterium]
MRETPCPENPPTKTPCRPPRRATPWTRTIACSSVAWPRRPPAVLLHGHVSLAQLVVVTWDTFALTALVLAWHVIAAHDPYEARRNARLQDASATFLFTLVIFAATASLVAVALVLHAVKDLGPTVAAGHVLLATTAIMPLLAAGAHGLHAALRASLLPRRPRRRAPRGPRRPDFSRPPDAELPGLRLLLVRHRHDLPGQRRAGPSARIRTLALVHGLISFVFNTAILAMFVNIVAGLV